MVEVIRIYEGAIALIPCVAHKYYEPCNECIDENLCVIREAFADVLKKTMDLLKKITLADLVTRKKRP